MVDSSGKLQAQLQRLQLQTTSFSFQNESLDNFSLAQVTLRELY